MYNPLLRITRTWILEKSLRGGEYFGCINRVYKVGFYLGLKIARKMKTVYFCLNIRCFYRLVHFIIIIFFFAIMHPDAPGLLAVPLINRFNQSSEKNIYRLTVWYEKVNTN